MLRSVALCSCSRLRRCRRTNQCIGIHRLRSCCRLHQRQVLVNSPSRGSPGARYLCALHHSINAGRDEDGPVGSAPAGDLWVAAHELTGQHLVLAGDALPGVGGAGRVRLAGQAKRNLRGSSSSNTQSVSATKHVVINTALCFCAAGAYR